MVLFFQRKAHLAKASGIRTARFMIDKYPDAFMKDDCDPHISVNLLNRMSNNPIQYVMIYFTSF